MNRRELLKMTAALTGAAVIGGDLFLSGCVNRDKKADLPLSDRDIDFLNEVAETILPATDTPGAREANVGAYMNIMVMDCYDEQNQQIFLDGLKTLKASGFATASPADKEQQLVALNKEAREYQKNKKKEDPAHYFTLIKQLTLLGYFTSEPGATKALRYLPIPTKYEGCIPYTKGDKAWAL